MGNNVFMGSFSSEFVKKVTFSPSTVWYISQCSEARGLQDLWMKVRPEVLKNLQESSVIQSVESSNRIEGVEVEKSRLIPLVLGKSRPRDRSEEEISGYRKALNYIHKNHASIDVNPETILKLHSYAQGGMISDAGVWKKKDNDIIEISPSGDRRIRFMPVTAKQTPHAIDQLCLGYRDVVQNSALPGLIAISNFVFDFLCIHPFRDGNGRVSRLLNLLLLYQHGFQVGKYVSLERLIENSKEDYYRVLGDSSKGWHQGQHDLQPWWNYQLMILRSAYQDLRERVELSTQGDSLSSLIRQAALGMNVPFCVSDIQKFHPSIDRELIKKVLFKLRDEKKIFLQGKGRSAKWKKS